MKLTKKILIIIILACSTLINGQTNSEILKRQAIEYMQAGLYEKAIDRLKNYISNNPFDADGYSLRGLCYERVDNYNYSYYDFKRARQIDSTDSEIARNFERIETEWKNSIYNIIDGYKSFTITYPDIAENYLKIADHYLLMENYLLAEKWYDEYLKRNHNSTSEEILKYTQVFAKNKSIAKGENLLSLYTFKYPDDWRLFTRLGYFKLWLGKNEEAKNAFTTALNIKPFNREAEEGLKLANSFVNYSVDDKLPIQNSYLIESYEQILLNDPNRDDIRFNLVEQQIISGLYDDAISNLQYLSPNYLGTSRYDDLMDTASDGRDEYLDKLIDVLNDKLDENKNDKSSLLQLVKIYNDMQKYSSSESIMEDYLYNHDKDDEIYYLLAKTQSYDSNYEEAYSNVLKAIKINSSNSDYKLLASRLIVLTNDEKEYAYAHKLLSESIKSNPYEIDALTILGRLYFLEGNFKDANTFAMQAAQIDASNPDLANLLFDLRDKNPIAETKKEVFTESPKVNQSPKVNDLEIGRSLVLNSKCDEAIDYYIDYIDENAANKDLLLEFADVYNCSEKYDEAINIYNFLLEKKDDYQIVKFKARSYYLDGDFDKTIELLSKLSDQHSDDFELQTLLADAYAQEGEYEFSRDIYNLIEQDAPENLLISQRKDWLPASEIEFNNEETSVSESGDGIFPEYLFSYANLYPEVTYYHGNDSYDFSTMGTGGEIGLFENISLGGNAHRGSLANDKGSINYMSYLGKIIYRPSPYWTIAGGYGKINSVNNINQPIYEFSVDYRGHTRYTNYTASAKYKYTDAATVVHSQALALNRLSAHYGNLNGWYRFRKGLNLYADYNIYLLKATSVFNENLGNSIDFKVTKEFYENLEVGYEYFFQDFKYFIPTYYSPQKFDSHSLWANWDVHHDLEWDINLIGRFGYIPDENHLVREISGIVVYKGIENLKITGNAFAGDTSRNKVGYRSFSFFLTATWNFIK